MYRTHNERTQIVFSSLRRVISKEILLVNDGHEDGEFNFEYTGAKPIALVPSAGHIDALSTLPIRVEYVATEPGAFREYATYALRNLSSTCVSCISEGFSL